MVTSASRTAVDVALASDRLDAIAVLDAVVRLHRTSGGTRGASLGELERECAAQGRRKGIAKVRGLLPHVDGGAASPMESKMRLRCVDGGLPRPQTQVRVRTARGVFHLDDGWKKYMVGLEYDSYEFHSGAEALRRDNTRYNALVEAGWQVFIAGPRQVLHSPDEFVRPVARAIAARGGSVPRHLTS